MCVGTFIVANSFILRPVLVVHVCTSYSVRWKRNLKAKISLSKSERGLKEGWGVAPIHLSHTPGSAPETPHLYVKCENGRSFLLPYSYYSFPN